MLLPRSLSLVPKHWPQKWNRCVINYVISWMHISSFLKPTLPCAVSSTTASYPCTARHSRDYYVRTVSTGPITTNCIEYLLLKSATGRYLEMSIRCQGRQWDKLNGLKTLLNLSINTLKNNRRIQTRQYWDLPRYTTNSTLSWRDLSNK